MNNKEVITGCKGLPDNTEPALEILNSLLLRKGDTLRLDYIRYRSVVREVYMDLNLHTIRRVRRFLLPVNKATGTVELPDTTLAVASVSVYDQCGKPVQLTRNESLDGADVVVVGESDDSGCESCRGNGRICNDIRSYEPIIETIEAPLPNGSTKLFECVTRKRLDADGTLWTEREYPVAKFIPASGSGGAVYLPAQLPFRFDSAGVPDGMVWDDTVLRSETTKVCAFETEATCGCVRETPANRRLLDECVPAGSWLEECGRCSSPVLEYRFSQEGGRLIVPKAFAFDKVLVRVYEDQPISELRVPLPAKKAFLYGLADAVALFDDAEPQYRIEKLEQRYKRAKGELLTLLGRWTPKELYGVLAAQRKMI